MLEELLLELGINDDNSTRDFVLRCERVNKITFTRDGLTHTLESALRNSDYYARLDKVLSNEEIKSTNKLIFMEIK